MIDFIEKVSTESYERLTSEIYKFYRGSSLLKKLEIKDETFPHDFTSEGKKQKGFACMLSKNLSC